MLECIYGCYLNQSVVILDLKGCLHILVVKALVVRSIFTPILKLHLLLLLSKQLLDTDMDSFPFTLNMMLLITHVS